MARKTALEQQLTASDYTFWKQIEKQLESPTPAASTAQEFARDVEATYTTAQVQGRLNALGVGAGEWQFPKKNELALVVLPNLLGALNGFRMVRVGYVSRGRYTIQRVA